MQVVLLLAQELLIEANVVGNREKYCKYSSCEGSCEI